jgi:hypothetical protein
MGVKNMYQVKVIDLSGLEGASYDMVYGDCPERFEDRAEAQKWADELNTSGEWPNGNPGYEVVIEYGDDLTDATKFFDEAKLHL